MNRSKLLQRISKEIERQTDGRDEDLLSYVTSFQQDCSRLPKLEKFNLLTPEGAQDALEKIDRTHAEIDRLLKNAQALRVLLEREA